jgi:hypothetical protein
MNLESSGFRSLPTREDAGIKKGGGKEGVKHSWQENKYIDWKKPHSPSNTQ